MYNVADTADKGSTKQRTDRACQGAEIGMHECRKSLGDDPPEAEKSGGRYAMREAASDDDAGTWASSLGNVGFGAAIRRR